MFLSSVEFVRLSSVILAAIRFLSHATCTELGQTLNWYGVSGPREAHILDTVTMHGTEQEWNHTEYNGESKAHGYGAGFEKTKTGKTDTEGQYLSLQVYI